MKYSISKNEELSEEYLHKVISQFMTKDLPRLKKYKEYYDGKMKMFYKQPSDESKLLSKTIVNYCQKIVATYNGYMTGTPIAYHGDQIDELLEIFNYNDIRSIDSEYLRQALIYGIAYSINYVDEDGKQRVAILDSRECIPIYDDTVEENLLYVVRIYKENDVINEKYIIEVYDSFSCRRYLSDMGFTTCALIENIPHYFKQCPVTVFKLNEDCASIFDQIMSLNDAYNELLSGQVTNWAEFADAYLILKGTVADSDDLSNMKKHRVLLLDNDSDAEYLTKGSVTDTQITEMLDNIDSKIHNISNCPDFTDNTFGTQSGIAIRYKLLGFECVSANIESNMKKAKQRQIELICTLLKLTDVEKSWRDINIVFKRNLPIDLEENADAVSKLKGIVSRQTLLSVLPFVYDVDKEMELVKAEQREEMDMYKEYNNDGEGTEQVAGQQNSKMPEED